ncbi:MAG TPA: prenyltransferase/squalene oxidase repeat-containing protein [Micromonosporaceae bacterium]|nr:prenyltransferase/squalene oxidase repeat-containing protein [Micromonosporaceae bacterium]
MVDIDAAIGFVVARGDQVDRARLSWLRSEVPAPPEMIAKVESGQTASGGWPATWGDDLPSVAATCFRLTELDDLGALERPAARDALRWLASRQRPDGTWEEDAALADVAPPWAQPGDAEATLYLTADAGFWMAVAGPPTPPPSPEATTHDEVVARASQAFRAALRPDGTWPSYLVAGWLGGALLYHTGWFYESAQIQLVLTDRIPGMSAADVAWLSAAFRRVGLTPLDGIIDAARRRLSETQRTDGGWASDDGDAFDVHTTLAAIRGLR